MSLPIVNINPTVTVANAPFCVGQSFAMGDVPSGSQVVTSFADFQCVPKNVWSDGSLKFAILSGRVNVSGTTTVPVQLAIGTPTSGTDIAASSISATAVVDCGAFGSVSWTGSDWASPFATWIEGPKMSSFIYRKPVGSDTHLVAWLEVRVWSGGELEVLPWIENGYTTITAPTNKSATYTFTLGGTSRFSAAIDLKHHQRTPLVSGTILSHWLATDPAISIQHDVAYMQESELVPSYSTTCTTATLTGILPTTYTPLQAGGFNYDSDYMPSTGYQSAIGVLPAHDVAYLVCSDNPKRVYDAVVRNGYSAGRYGIHYREPATNLPLRFSSYPTLVIADNQGFGDTGSSTTGSRTPTATGGNPPVWDIAHHPSVGYFAYLVTGRYYFMEQIQFAATANYLNNGDNTFLRTGSQGLHQTAAAAHQTRSCAWGWRTHAQALSVTPDDDTFVRPELINSYVSNIDAFHTRYAGQTNNPGWIYPGENYGQQNLIAGWQQDFVTATWGMALALDLPIPSATKIKEAALFQWKARSVVMRLEAAAYNNTPYVTKTAASNNPNYTDGTGVFYLTGADINTQTLLTPNDWYSSTPAWYSSDPDVLSIEDPSLWGYSMNAQLMAAAAYAERFGVPDAAEGRARFMAASNYSSMTSAFTTRPVWSIEPLFAGTPPEDTLATPGPSFVWDTTPLVSGGFVWDTYRGLGIPAEDIPTGFDLPPLLLNDIDVDDLEGTEYRVEILTLPASGTLTMFNDSSFTFEGPDGTHTGTQRVYKNGESEDTTYSFTIGEETEEPTITGVIISPSTATGSTTFTATVSGTGAFSSAKTFSKISGGGSINSTTGVFTAPAETSTIQIIVVRATSTQDPTQYDEAIITIPSSVVVTPPAYATTVSFSVVTANNTNVTADNLDYAFYDEPRISAGYAPVKVGTDLAIINGVGTISIAGVTTLLPGQTGRILWGDAAGNKQGGGPVTVT